MYIGLVPCNPNDDAVDSKRPGLEPQGSLCLLKSHPKTRFSRVLGPSWGPGLTSPFKSNLRRRVPRPGWRRSRVVCGYTEMGERVNGEMCFWLLSRQRRMYAAYSCHSPMPDQHALTKWQKANTPGVRTFLGNNALLFTIPCRMTKWNCIALKPPRWSKR